MINGSTRAMTEKEQRGLPFLIVSEATDGIAVVSRWPQESL